MSDAIESLPGVRTTPESDPIDLFVDTPMDGEHTRSDCETRVHGWGEYDFASVSIVVDIDAVEPLELSCGTDDARELATAILAAAARADELLDGTEER